MNIKKEFLKRQISTASKRTPADVVIKNGQIIDVFNLEIFHGDVAITDGMFVGIGDYEGNHTIDAQNRYICPSFIDGHVHIESSMVTPAEYAKVVLPHGVTTVITDPHEIGNVCGVEGIKFMLSNSKNIPLDVFVMLPSSVPATSFENAGAKLTATDLEPFYKHKRVLGLAEVMDFPALMNGKNSIINKIAMTTDYREHIDGHLAGLNANAINIYRAAGIKTDHECNSITDAFERLRRGMYVMIREGSAAKDLDALIKAVNIHNARRFLFCTDDKHLDDLIEEGSIDHNIRKAIHHGVNPLLAIQIASLNAAECYHLTKKGAIAPGYEADFLLLEDLDKVKISEVYKAGKLVAQNGEYVGDSFKKNSVKKTLTNTVKIPSLTRKDINIAISEIKMAQIIEIIPNQLKTNKLIQTVHVENGSFVPSIENDQLKIIVVERHKMTGNIGLGVVKGFGFKEGALATTIAHDSHNIVATGTNDEDILKAVDALKEMKGGLAIVKKGEVIGSLPLPVAGLLTEEEYQIIYQKLQSLKQQLTEVGFTGNFNPFLTLSFLTLPVIPSLKLTDIGLFDVENFRHIQVNKD